MIKMIKIINISITAVRFLMIVSNSCLLTLSSVQSLSRVWLLATPWTAARQASLSITNPRSLLRLTTLPMTKQLLFCFLVLWSVCIFWSFIQMESCVCVCVSHMLCDSIDCSPPGSSVHVISQARALECVAISSSRGSSWPLSLHLLHWQVDSLSLCHLGIPHGITHMYYLPDSPWIYLTFIQFFKISFIEA